MLRRGLRSEPSGRQIKSMQTTSTSLRGGRRRRGPPAAPGPVVGHRKLSYRTINTTARVRYVDARRWVAGLTVDGLLPGGQGGRVAGEGGCIGAAPKRE